MNYSEELLNINLAIEKIQNGAQEYRIGSRSVTKADLKTLYDERRKLENTLNNNENSTFVARLRRR